MGSFTTLQNLFKPSSISRWNNEPLLVSSQVSLQDLDAKGVDPGAQESLPRYTHPELRKLFLTEGHIIITTVPADIITVLGSCVAVCIWDKNKKIGAMNHFLLPGNVHDETSNPSRGASATDMLIKSMINRKCNKEDLEAKVFGGCNSLHQNEVGKKNIEVAVFKLKEAGIRIVASHTGGSFGRKIVFNTRTGKVLMRLLNKSLAELNDEIARGLGV